MEFVVYFCQGYQEPTTLEEEADKEAHLHFLELSKWPLEDREDLTTVKFNCFFRGNEMPPGHTGTFYWPVHINTANLQEYIKNNHADLIDSRISVYNTHPVLLEREYQKQVEEAIRVVTKLTDREGILRPRLVAEKAPPLHGDLELRP